MTNRPLQLTDGVSELPLSQLDKGDHTLHLRPLGGGYVQATCLIHQREWVIPQSLVPVVCADCLMGLQHGA